MDLADHVDGLPGRVGESLIELRSLGPDYAAAAARWALECAPGPRALDLGAGTGKLSATLVALGVDVVAVEPDPAMRTATLDRIREFLAGRPETAEGDFTLPMLTGVLRARRL